MTDTPILTIEDARTALDEEIKDVQWWVNLYTREADEAKAKLAPYQKSLWKLREIRERMNPPVAPGLTVVASSEEAA